MSTTKRVVMEEISLSTGDVASAAQDVSEWLKKDLVDKEEGWYRFFPKEIQCSLQQQADKDSSTSSSSSITTDWTQTFAKDSLAPCFPKEWDFTVEFSNTSSEDPATWMTTMYIKTNRLELRKVTRCTGEIESHYCHVNVELYLKIRSDMQLVISGMKFMPKLVIEVD